MTSVETQLAVIATSIEQLKGDVTAIKKKLDSQYVTKDQLAVIEAKNGTVRKIVFTFVGAVLLAIVGALLKLVIAQ